MSKLGHGESAGIGAGIGSIIPGFGTVLGAAIGSLFGGNPNRPPPLTYAEANPNLGNVPNGVPGMPGRVKFDPVGKRLPLKDIDRGPFPEGPLYNPYGISRPTKFYGKTPVYGGQEDLAKSVATRSVALSLLKDEMDSAQGPPPGLEPALKNYAGGGLLGEAYQNYSPTIERDALQNNLNYRNQLSGLMQNAYLLGGGLYGGALEAWAQAKQQDKARREAKNAALQNYVGAFLPQEFGIRDIGKGAAGMAG